MRRVTERIEVFAETRGPVLVLGEAGTGRELIARILHVSNHKGAGSFVQVHGGSAPANLFYSGANPASGSTLRSASGGTLLIKDLCELPRTEQKRLMRALCGRGPTAAGELDVMVVGSCDIDLAYAVDAGVFGGELYDVFAAREIVVPALRDRTADIPQLASSFIREYGREIGRNRMTLSTRAYERLVKYPWPGNVAELKGIARRLVYRSKKSRIEAGDVDGVLPVVAERVPLENMSLEDMVRTKLGAFLRRVDGYPMNSLYDDVITRVEKPMLDLVMQATGGNQLRAAELLGLNRNTLRRKLTDHGLLARKGTRRKGTRAGRARASTEDASQQ